MKDLIRVVGCSFYGYHGVLPAEREVGGIFEVDCELEVDLTEAGHSDRLTDTIDYGEVYRLIKETVEETSFSLLEALAERLATILLDKFPAYRVTLHVRKMRPPIPGQIKHIEVVVTRLQPDVTKLTARRSEGT